MSEDLHKTSKSLLRKVVDKVSNNEQTYYYDKNEQLVSVSNTSNGYVDSVDYEYDDHKRLSVEDVYTSNGDIITDFEYRNNGAEPTNEIEKVTIECNIGTNTFEYSSENENDELKRISKIIKSVGNYEFEQEFTYPTISYETTLLPAIVTYKKRLKGTTNNTSMGGISYSYDSMNNITSVNDYSLGEFSDISYTYDLFGRLIRENNQKLGKSIKYTYDDKGNITKKEEGNYTTGDVTVNKTTHYSYSTTYPDRLVSYSGQGIAYDLNGNPTNLGVKALTWTKSKQLSQIQINDFNKFTYTYDADGRRLSKTGPLQESHQYVYNGDKLISEVLYRQLGGTKNLTYLYSGNEIIGLICNNVSYLFIKNLQRDIIGIVDSTGNIVAKYVYDAWGNHVVCNPDGTTNTTVSFIGNINPFRYRGYYYDTESGLYWCKTRYYNPEWGRWTSPDSIEYLDPESINGLNLYSYCNNDPVNMYDPSGHLAALASMLFTPVGGTVSQVFGSILGYLFIACWALGDLLFNNGNGAWKDMCDIYWNPFNSDVSKTLSSDYVSFYEGVPVFRTDLDRSGSFIAIFLSRGHYDSTGTYITENNPDTVRHERGHNWQLMMMGIGTYGFTIGIPSPLKLGSWAKNNNYYGAPWETMANILGGVQGRTHSNAEINNAWNYYAISSLCFPLTALYWF